MADLEVLATADIVVVGAGIAGLCTAFELRRRGFDVVVVEQRFASFGSSGRNPGAIWLQTRRTGLELNLARAGKEKYDEYIAELGNVFEYRSRGGLFFFETDEQGAVLEQYASDRAAAGLQVELVDRETALKHSPFLPDTAIGAVFCPEDAQLDPNAFVTALGQACVRAGVRQFDKTPVLSTIRDGDRVLGVRTVRGEVHAGGLVWATGSWATNLRAEGIVVPVETARMGQVVTQPVDQRPSAVLHGPRGVAFAGALTDLASFRNELFAPPTSGLTTGANSEPMVEFDDTIAQNRGGSMFLGNSIDGRGALNPHVSLSATQAMVGTAVDRFAGFAHHGVTGLWGGLMSETPDHLPIVDRMDGAYVNVGHAWGMSSGPICGQVLAELIAGENSHFGDGLRADREALASTYTP